MNTTDEPPTQFPIEAGHIWAFARAIGDTRQEYAPADDPRRQIAPPTFVQSSVQFMSDYRLRPTVGQPWFGSGVDSGHVPPGAGALHAEQSFEYHKPVVAGMTLHVVSHPGRTWAKEGSRGGTLEFREVITEYRDDSGELVVTATGVSVRTERTIGRDS